MRKRSPSSTSRSGPQTATLEEPSSPGRPTSARAWFIAAALAVLVTALHAGSAAAADTTETWDVGVSDFEFFLGVDGVGPEGGDRMISSDLLIGVGVVDGLSAYIGSTLAGEDLVGPGEVALRLGVFGTPVDTDHFDLDLFLDTSAAGEGLADFQVSPALEVNFDASPNQESWGTYLRLGVPVYGRPTGSDTGDDAEHEAAVSLVANPGVYVTLAPGHQLLAEFDASFHDASADEHAFDLGGVALGYNVFLRDKLELVSQLYVDLPQADEVAVVGVTTGFIATLPTGR